MLDKIISPMESSLIALAVHDGACVSLRAMDFAFMAFKAAFVAEAFEIAGFDVAYIWTDMLVLMSSIST